MFKCEQTLMSLVPILMFRTCPYVVVTVYVTVDYINIYKVKQSRYRPGVAPRVPGN